MSNIVRCKKCGSSFMNWDDARSYSCPNCGTQHENGLLKTNSKITLTERCKQMKDLPIYLKHRTEGACEVISCGQGAIYVRFEKTGRSMGYRFPYAVDVGDLQLDKEREEKENCLKIEAERKRQEEAERLRLEEEKRKAEEEKLKQERKEEARKRRESILNAPHTRVPDFLRKIEEDGNQKIADIYKKN